MAAVANKNIAHDQYLGKFTEMVTAANVTNFLVIALDNNTGAYLASKHVTHYVRRFTTRTGADSSTTDNHATSALKFEVLTELLSIGVSVLLSDVDVAVLHNPFASLYRDSDIENMSDGWDDDSVYGFVHSMEVPDDGGHGPLRSLRYETRNSGLLYVAATVEGLRTVRILAQRMNSEAVWDQSAWNQETFRAATSSHPVGGASVRVINYFCVMNTKLLFKYLPHARHLPADVPLGEPHIHVPTMAHMNYHPEKEQRMAATLRFYREKDRSALREWNGGEGRNTGGCQHKVGVPTQEMPPLDDATATNHTLISNLLASHTTWRWGSSHSELRAPITFAPNGTVGTPWGEGTWGAVPGPWRKDAVHVRLLEHGLRDGAGHGLRDGAGHGIHQTYILMFLSEKWAFVGVRCSDERVSYGRVAADPIPEKRLVW